METGLPLTEDMMLILGILGFAVFMFVVEWVRSDVTALLILVALGATELVPSDHLFDGFSSNAVMSILAVMILGAGLERTGLLARAAGAIVRLSGGVERRLHLLLSGIAGGMSAFMQNPACTTLFLPVASRISSRTGLPLARLLLPMATCIVLGGTITLVGSSPMILLNDLLSSANRNLPQGVATLKQLGMFAVAPVGFALLVAGLVFFLLFGKRLLPAGEDKQSVTPGRTESYFANVYGIAGEVMELLVTAESPLVGLSIGEAETQRDAPLILAIKNSSESRLAPPADEMIWVGTVLGVMGRRDSIVDYAQKNLCRVLPRLRNFGDLFNPTRAGVSEAVVPPGSRFVGKSVGDLRLRKRFGISLLAVNRGENIYREDVRKVSLRAGDTLVFHSFWRDLSNLAEEKDFVVVTDYPKEEQRPQKAWLALAFFALAVGLALFQVVAAPIALLAGAVGMLLFGVLAMDEAYKAISWKTVFLLASLIPLGAAMDSTGAAAWLAEIVFTQIEGTPVWVMQIAVAITTSLFAILMTNVGATVLMVPMAINLALAANTSPLPFAVLVALSASNNFLLPASNPVLSLISGPAGYRSRDFLRVGIPMTLLFIGVELIAVRLLFGD